MKILVLLPINEVGCINGMNITKILNTIKTDANIVTIPNLMEYFDVALGQKNALLNYCRAASYTKEVAKDDKHLIVLGNVSKDLVQFDAVFAFMDVEYTAPYTDKMLEKMKNSINEIKAVTGEEKKAKSKIEKFFKNLYTNKDALTVLKDYSATAFFLQEYLSSEKKEVKEPDGINWKKLRKHKIRSSR